MKTTLVILITFVLTVGGCDHEDIIDYGLEGQWNLTHINGGLAGVDISIDPGTIFWTFDESQGTVTIVNNSENGYGFPSGTYPFSIEETGDYKTITIDGTTYGIIEVSKTQIHIDQRASDGLLFELTK